ncbi:MAG: anaerobic ribonucleoside-triphosphate reductase [Candidatus Freyarchaeota archaeon]|nr:anaerobic ribonucleoside-triphosphate reductase [Candidatus Freyrarchaeum guaymaensis]
MAGPVANHREYPLPQEEEEHEFWNSILPPVRTNRGMIEKFDVRKIIDSLVREAEVSRDVATEVAKNVVKRIISSNIRWLSGPMIREMCCSVLAEMGLVEARKKYTRIGIPIYDLNEMIINPLRHTWNANLQVNPETIAKVVYDRVMTEHTFLTLPGHLEVTVPTGKRLVFDTNIADAHLMGDNYHKDREYTSIRDYCASWDPRLFIILGLEPDGLNGMHSSSAGPPKHLTVFVNHAAIWLASWQSNMSGGQGFHNWMEGIAWYLRGLKQEELLKSASLLVSEMNQPALGLTDELYRKFQQVPRDIVDAIVKYVLRRVAEREIEQACQHTPFIATQQYVARGGQVPFTSIDIGPGIKKEFMNEPVILPGGKTSEKYVYGDFVDEVKRYFIEFMKVMYYGDRYGKLFNYPKLNIELREEWMKPEFEEAYIWAARLVAKYGLPYFVNYLNWRKQIIGGCVSCCSHTWAARNPEQVEEYISGNAVYGAIQMDTPNPVASAARTMGQDEDAFFEDFGRIIEEVTIPSLLHRYEVVKRVKRLGLAPLYNVKRPNGKDMIVPEERELLIGTIGFAEMVEIVTGYPLWHEEGLKFAVKVLKFMNKIAQEWSNETGLSFQVTRTPAETAAGKLARILYERYPEVRPYLRGKYPDVYLTNSVHQPVDADIPLAERIKKEAMFAPLLGGGFLQHIFLNDVYPDPYAIWKFILKIARNTLTAYFDFTIDIWVCPDCRAQGTFDWRNQHFDSPAELVEFKCPKCGSQRVEIYSRITGYLQGIKATWNDPKKQEFLDRRRYNLNV